jgi:hypothetical protein
MGETVSQGAHFEAKWRADGALSRSVGKNLARKLDGGPRDPQRPARRPSEPGPLNRSAAALSVRPTASRGGAAARADGLGMTHSITTITTPTAGTG